MRILVLGATGHAGQHVTTQALQRAYNVTAVVRRDTLPRQTNLKVMTADPCKAAELAAILPGHDAVISCLGHRPEGNPWLVRDAAEATLSAMQSTGVTRYLVISGALLYPTYNPITMLIQRMMKARLMDGRAAEQVVSRSQADWTILRPPHLLEGNQKKGYQVGQTARLTQGLPFIDLAECLLDLCEQRSHIREIVGVSPARR